VNGQLTYYFREGYIEIVSARSGRNRSLARDEMLAMIEAGERSQKSQSRCFPGLVALNRVLLDFPLTCAFYDDIGSFCVGSISSLV